MNKQFKLSDKTPDVISASTSVRKSENEPVRSTCSPLDRLLHLQRTIGNRAVQRLLNTAVIEAKPVSSEDMIMMKTHEGTAKKIVSQIRDEWGVDPGNRHEEIIMSGGRSFAGVSLLFLIYKNDARGAWLAPENVKKRATLSYDLKAANCDEFADMAYCQGRAENTGAQIAIERQPGHAYAVMYDQEDKNKRPKHTIIDPWIKRAHLRKDNEYYMREGTAVYDETQSDGQGWYLKDYYLQQLKRYNPKEIEAYNGRNAQAGKELAERKNAASRLSTCIDYLEPWSLSRRRKPRTQRFSTLGNMRRLGAVSATALPCLYPAFER